MKDHSFMSLWRQSQLSKYSLTARNTKKTAHAPRAIAPRDAPIKVKTAPKPTAAQSPMTDTMKYPMFLRTLMRAVG